MIYTVTMNPALDRSVVIPEFQAGCVNRIRQSRKDPGGKGINVSKVLHKLGTRSVAMGILAGTTGDEIEHLLADCVEERMFLRIPGESRTNLKVTDPVNHTVTDINEPGPEIDEDSLERLLGCLTARLREGDLVVLSGSLPAGAQPDVYRHWTEQCRQRGAKVILDADGPALQRGIEGRPWMVKPNEAELSRLTGHICRSEEELCEAADHLLAAGVELVVISRGEKGALFADRTRRLAADALPVRVVNTVGAGDTMVAAVAWAKEQGLTMEETVRLAVAASAAKVMQTGSQPPEMELVNSLRDLVVVRTI